MKLPQAFELLILLPARKVFPSGKEDAQHITQDLQSISDYFNEVSKIHQKSAEKTPSIEHLQSLIRSYQGQSHGRRRILFFDEVAS